MFLVMFRLFYCLLLLVSLCLQTQRQAHAIDYFDDRITEEERAVFAFFKAGGISPDYDKWIKGGEAYFAVSEKYKDDFFLQENLRLGRGYTKFDPNIDFLSISAPIIVRLSDQDDKQHKVEFSFFQNVRSYTPTFDFPYVKGEIISLVVNQLGYFSSLEIPDAQYEYIRARVPDSDDLFRGVLEMKVRVKSSDMSKAYPIDYRHSRWIMVGEIAYIKCRLPSVRDGEVVLWDHSASWYRPPVLVEKKKSDKDYPHPFDLFKD